MDEQDVIRTFVSHLGEHKSYPNLHVGRWPDKEERRKPKTEPEIDAIAGCFAIEHTSVDSVPDARRNSARYSRVAGGLEREFVNYVDFHLSVVLEYNAIRKGQDWSNLRAALKSWVEGNALELSYGSHDLVLPIKPPVVPPFRIQVLKRKDGPLGIFFPSVAPPIDDKSLSVRFKEKLKEKGLKLAKYQDDYTTILLVENAGFPLIVGTTIVDAIQVAFPNTLPHGADEIWVIDTDTGFYQEITI